MPPDRFMPRYITELDGLRGVAVIAVMIFHANIPFFKGDKFLQGGFIGVDIFFVLSGFLITSILVSEFDRTGSISLKNFYIRRFLRLGPALIGLLVVFCLTSFMVLNEEEARKNYFDAIISAAYLSNWARAFLIHPPDYLGHTWSLSIEEQFYIIWPIILFFLLRITQKRQYVLITATFFALLSWALRSHLANNGATIARLFNGLDTRADALMLGCAVGVMLSNGFLKPTTLKLLQRLLPLLNIFSIVGLLFFSVLSNWYVLWMHYWGFFIVELFTVIIILNVTINSKGIFNKILMMKWLVWIGSISYGLYLWHYPIFRTISSLGLQGWSKFIVGIVITFIISIISYYALELPILKLKTKFANPKGHSDILPSVANIVCSKTYNISS